MIPYSAHDAQQPVDTFASIAPRLVALSSGDVYRAYDRLRRRAPGAPDPVPLTEASPRRDRLYRYRDQATAPDDERYHYEKILVEDIVMQHPSIAGTVLRLPMVYGPRDGQHRLFPYLKRMDDRRPAILLDAGQAQWRWARGYVENVAAAIVLAVLDERARHRIYNVGEAVALIEMEWISAIGSVVGWRGRIMPMPVDALPPHLRTDLDWSQDLTTGTTRIRRELGYDEPVTREEALRRTIAWERVHPPGDRDPARDEYAAEDALLRSYMLQ
jgi:nucleoside-diphosphate-sugar epimerase